MASMTKEAFSQLVVQYERLVYTICFQLVRDAAAAEDLTQETFLSAYLHRDTMPAGYERQWLARIAANKAKDHLQSAYNRRTVLPGDEEMPPGLLPAAEEIALQRSGSGYFPLDPGTQRALPAGLPAVPAGGEIPGGSRAGIGQTGQDDSHTARPRKAAFAGTAGKEEIGWNVFALMDT